MAPRPEPKPIAYPTLSVDARSTPESRPEQAALEYNSLQAQEEICKNYVAIRAADPQMERKWTFAQAYSDAGFSGGTLERPALKRLLADIEAGKIDVIVAYKIDRISRSISQFYEVWKHLETHHVDFASATQELNTATSQGKLMLNLLLSFAQYERELIGERTRDKIAAARKNGRWCGGKPILGYDIDKEKNRLVVNEAEARIVRDLFQIYLEEGSLLRALKVVNEKGYRTKQWVTSTGRKNGGHTFDKVTLNRVLLNPAYLGKVRHLDQLYPGQHDAIVAPELFESVRKVLGDHHKPHATTGLDHDYLLRGLVRCGACGRAMTPSSAMGRNQKKYFYYLCTRAIREGASSCPVRRVSAPAVEKLAFDRLRQLVSSETMVAAIVKVAAREAAERSPQLCEERDRLEGELRKRREEAKRLVDAIASGASSAGMLSERLREAEAAIKAVEARIARVSAEAARLQAKSEGPDRVRGALGRFTELWQSVPRKSRAGLMRLLVPP
jgi:site-specific DNA recombinase